MPYKSALTISCWNIHGLYNNVNGSRICKLDYPDFYKSVTDSVITCLQETHCSFNDNIEIDGYHVFNHVRPKSTGAKKHSGGMCIIVKKDVKYGIKFVDASHPDIVWFKVCKDVLQLILICMFVQHIYHLNLLLISKHILIYMIYWIMIS